jgi:type II secretory pathway component PulJ
MHPSFIIISALLVCAYSLLRSISGSNQGMSQEALLLEEVGKPLVLGNRPIPEAGENQLLVKVLVAGCKFKNT